MTEKNGEYSHLLYAYRGLNGTEYAVLGGQHFQKEGAVKLAVIKADTAIEHHVGTLHPMREADGKTPNFRLEFPGFGNIEGLSSNVSPHLIQTDGADLHLESIKPSDQADLKRRLKVE